MKEQLPKVYSVSMPQGRCGARPYFALEFCSVGRGTAPAQLRITFKRMESDQNFDVLYNGCIRDEFEYNPMDRHRGYR